MWDLKWHVICHHVVCPDSRKSPRFKNKKCCIISTEESIFYWCGNHPVFGNTEERHASSVPRRGVWWCISVEARIQNHRNRVDVETGSTHRQPDSSLSLSAILYNLLIACDTLYSSIAKLIWLHTAIHSVKYLTSHGSTAQLIWFYISLHMVL